MAKSVECAACEWEKLNEVTIDLAVQPNKSQWAREIGISEGAVRRHLSHEPRAQGSDSPPPGERFARKPDGTIEFDNLKAIRTRMITVEDARVFLRAGGDDPDDYDIGIRSIAYADDKFSNGYTARPKRGAAGPDGTPAFPLIQPARDPYIIPPLTITPKATRFQTAVVASDHQFGYDMLDDGTLVPYHDDAAIDIFEQIVGLENPAQTILAGDIFDLTEQSRWPQKSGYARTTQPSLDRGRLHAATMRARTDGKIKFVEGNHDKRMQSFMEANAMAGMGLKKSGYPDSWPVMSIPNLIGLDEFDIDYVDAYPVAAHWITDGLRVIHGTKANSAGSTAAQYANANPNISTIFGHTHRQEVQAKTIFDRAGKIKTFDISPGCLCRVDGTVPSVNGARHMDGTAATYWENWQQGVLVVRYLDDGTFFYEMVQIEDGHAMHGGQELTAAI